MLFVLSEDCSNIFSIIQNLVLNLFLYCSIIFNLSYDEVAIITKSQLLFFFFSLLREILCLLFLELISQNFSCIIFNEFEFLSYTSISKEVSSLTIPSKYPSSYISSTNEYNFIFQKLSNS